MKKLTHTADSGEARMVDVGAKKETKRLARATGSITMSREAFDAISDNKVTKGDVLAVARIAGTMAAKKTSDLIPLCHNISLTDASVDLELDSSLPGVQVSATAQTVGRTGVEMEALTAVAVALLTIYDMTKAIDRSMTIGEIALAKKTGGKSGDWRRG
jgi:cyclic pyranopterin monophosphate synthase